MSGRRTLFVAGIGPSTRAKELAYEFERFGRLVRCDIPVPRAHGKPYAFVEFEDARDADDAYQDMHGRRVDGYSLNIQWARNAPSKSWRYDGPRGSERQDRRDDRRRSASPTRRRRSSRSPRRSDYQRRSRSRSRERDIKRRRSRSRSKSPGYMDQSPDKHGNSVENGDKRHSPETKPKLEDGDVKESYGNSESPKVERRSPSPQ